METINLWQDLPPGQQEGFEVPKITYYQPKTNPTGAAVITFAGGGYDHRAIHEGSGYCEWLTELGVAAFNVEYRVSPAKFPLPLLDARRAVRYVRANAAKHGIDPEKIAVMGSSAGGHLVALLSTYKRVIEGEGVDELDAVDFLPNAQILCYPVTDYNSHMGSYKSLLGKDCTENESLAVTPYLLASESTPKAFIWHTSSDSVVNVNGSLKYAEKLHNVGVPVEMHIYPVGGHGLGLGYHPEKNINEPYIQKWTDNLVAWLKLYNYI